MGVYAEYLDRGMSFQDLTAERKAQLARISRPRGGRDLIVYAADMRKHRPPEVSAMIQYDDLLPIADQLSNLSGAAVDVILETPGGYAEIVEDIVRALREKYAEVGFIVPGMAKSAGTIMVMSGNEILLEPNSSLGPIDAQLTWQGKTFSAEAFLEGLKKMKSETDETKSLNRAYIPILQNISPGEIQHAQNALDFAQTLVTEWLCRYKFQNWATHSSTGLPVTEEERRTRAQQIAAELCRHGRWLSHGRSVKLSDLVGVGLKVTDYSTQPDLFDAIRRYYILLRMSFETNMYKLIETPTSQIYRFSNIAGQQGKGIPGERKPTKAEAEITCSKCAARLTIQMNFEPGVAVEEGRLLYPSGDILKCPGCGNELNVADARRQVEAVTKRGVIPV